jgi:DNA mismatch endonuclease, patch repair protein
VARTPSKRVRKVTINRPHQQPNELRSKTMRAVRSKDTTPERIVRTITHNLGLRFRLHRTDLPGKPDLVLIRRRIVIFVHGCFWHGHDCARGARAPKTNVDYWVDKIGRNRTRDMEHSANLLAAGWRVEVIWECETRQIDKLIERIRKLKT